MFNSKILDMKIVDQKRNNESGGLGGGVGCSIVILNRRKERWKPTETKENAIMYLSKELRKEIKASEKCVTNLKRTQRMWFHGFRTDLYVINTLRAK